jgi:amino acid adenylation domain-containing protein
VQDTGDRELLAELSSHGVMLRSRRGRLVIDAPAGTPSTLLDRLDRRQEAALQAIVAHPGLSGPRLAPVTPTTPATPSTPAFPLTDLQSAYLVGESDFPELRTPAFVAHGFEVPDLDPGRLRRAMLAVLRAHEMLRVRVEPSGLQRVMDLDPGWRPATVDWRHLDAGRARERFRHEVHASGPELGVGLGAGLPTLEDGPQLSCTVFEAAGTWFVLIRLRLFVFDARSIGLVCRDLAAAYGGAALDPAGPPGTFGRYVAALAGHRDSQAYRNAVAHWQRRIEDLPAEPALPLLRPPVHSRFARVRHRTGPQVWAHLQQRARGQGLSVNTVLCTAYAEVLRRWASGQERFCLTVLVSTRPMLAPEPVTPDTYTGNFGSTLLLECDGTGHSFLERAAAIQQRLMDDLPHSWVSGVDVKRRARRTGRAADVGSRFVFASGLVSSPGEELPPHLELDGWQLVTKAMHTPQVLLDHQVSEEDGELVATFDHVVSAFPAGLVEDLAQAHADLLARVAQDDAAWTAPGLPPLPAAQLRQRLAANATGRRFPPASVLGGLPVDHRAHAPSGGIALQGDGVELSYGECAEKVRRLATAIPDSPKESSGELVGVLARKSPGQYLAALAVIASGAAYVPLGIDWPPQRIASLLGEHGIERVVADEEGARVLASCRAKVAMIPLAAMDAAGSAPGITTPEPADPTRLAYVMFTSGSTGAPKGVAISHGGLLNTVQDMVARFGLGPHDRILSLSELHFDLSAFDLFGALHCGGTVVVPPLGPIPDPDLWAHWLRSSRATVWNTVPALLEMLLDHLGDRAGEYLGSLRLVLLSGDWVPVNLPGRLKAVQPATTVVALGGATEASIWSNFHVVDGVDPGWSSIPYGRPLANQRFHVLDGQLHDQPAWVAGELCIAGDGLATAYYGQPELTGRRFPTHPQTGERLYRTGDQGRYWPDGTLEFLGRNDNQVKVRGHRVDLLEVEQRLAALPGVRQAACVVLGRGSSSRLVAFTVPHEVISAASMREADSATSMRDALARTLPPYAVPTSFRTLPALPLTSNGKRDTSALLAMAADSDTGQDVARPAHGRAPLTQRERALARLWEQVCDTPVHSLEDDFFTIGGSSVSAVRLLRLIETEFGARLALSSLFAASTLGAQVALLESSSNKLLVPLRPGRGTPVVLVHPVGGHLLGYRDLAAAICPEHPVHGIQSPPAGDLPATLEALAAREALDIAELGEPAHLVGWSLGGVLAAEIAHRLAATGAAPLSLTLLDSFVAAPSPARHDTTDEMQAATACTGHLALGEGDGPDQSDGLDVALYRLLLRYTPRPLPELPAVLVVGAGRQGHDSFPGLMPLAAHPGALVPAGAEVVTLPETHFSIVRAPAARSIAHLLAHPNPTNPAMNLATTNLAERGPS